MIARSSHEVVEIPWQTAYRQAFRRPQELLSMLGLQALTSQLATRAGSHFPFLVTREFASRMKPGDANDPLLLQVLPDVREDNEVAGFSSDPVAELNGAVDGQLIRKYRGRALLVLTAACAIHCRYCFRREFPYNDSVGMTMFERGLEQIQQDKNLTEIILSGGDPLMFDNSKLAHIWSRVSALPQVRRMRIHTRLPIALPQRVDQQLADMLGRCANDSESIVIIHANHPNEIDHEVGIALRRLKAAGVTVMNQAVLLRGVNDSAAALAALSERLFEYGVLPYYLHQLDRVNGSAHFEVDDDSARTLINELRGQLPGYLVPRLVREVAGDGAKRALS